MSLSLPDTVRIVEVGPRDGLQNETAELDVATRVTLIERLADSGLSTIEAGSFVSPRWIPQMADSGQVLTTLHRRRGVRYTALTPNRRGLEDAMAAGADEVAVFAAASEAFSQHNINCSIAESVERFREVCEQASAAGLPVRGYVSCVLGCPYQGAVSESAVYDVTRRLLDLGCYEVSLGDTIGVGTAGRVESLLSHGLQQVPSERLAVHFHDTYGQALANVLMALQCGVRSIDSSVAGLGGCPYAPGASGNVATEDVVYLLDGLGMRHGVDLEQLRGTGDWICGQLGRNNRSRVANALAAAQH